MRQSRSASEEVPITKYLVCDGARTIARPHIEAVEHEPITVWAIDTPFAARCDAKPNMLCSVAHLFVYVAVWVRHGGDG